MHPNLRIITTARVLGRRSWMLTILRFVHFLLVYYYIIFSLDRWSYHHRRKNKNRIIHHSFFFILLLFFYYYYLCHLLLADKYHSLSTSCLLMHSHSVDAISQRLLGWYNYYDAYYGFHRFPYVKCSLVISLFTYYSVVVQIFFFLVVLMSVSEKMNNSVVD